MSGFYLIVSRMNGMALDVERSNTASGTRVMTWNRTGADNQLWYDDPSTGTIRSKLNNFCLAGEDDLLVLKPFDVDDHHMLWERHGHHIRNRHHHHRVLDIYECNREAGATVGVYDFHGNENQSWEFEFVGGAPPFYGGLPTYAEEPPMCPGGQIPYGGQGEFYGGQPPCPGGQPPHWGKDEFYGGQPPFAGGQPPFAGEPPLFAGGQPPFPGGQPPYAGGQPPFPGGQSPFAGEQPLFAGGQPPFVEGQPPFSSGPYYEGQSGYQVPSASTYPGARREFMIVSDMNKKVVDIQGGCPDEGTRVLMWDKNDERNQIWYTDGQGYIRSALNDMVFHNSGPGEKLKMKPFTSDPRGMWLLAENQIVNGASECLDIKGANHEDGAKLISYQYNGHHNQHWHLHYID